MDGAHNYSESDFMYRNANPNFTSNVTLLETTATHPEIIPIFKLYVAPCLLFLGTLGNILSFIIFSRNALRESHVAFYFRVVAVGDTLALNLGLWPNWLRDLAGIQMFPPKYDAVCRLKLYSKYVLSDFPVWILVVMSIERLISVYAPLKVRQICTKRRVVISVITVALGVLLLNSPVLFLLSSKINPQGQPKCVPHMALYFIWPWVDLVLYCLLPFLFMVGCNSAIIFLVASRRRGFMPDRAGSNMAAMTGILLTVCFVFILLTSPFVVYTVFAMMHKRGSNISPYMRVFHIVASTLRYVNNSVNFLLYCVSGKPFRRELLAMCRCRTSSQVDYQPATRTTSMLSRSRSSYSRSSSVF